MLEAERINEIVAMMSIEGEDLTEVELTDDDFSGMTEEQAADLAERFGGSTLVRLPQKERDFFEWLRREDPDVWSDLWGRAPNETEGYFVGVSHLPSFLPKKRGFPICDLQENDNYHFVGTDITDDNGKIHLETALDVVAEGRTIAIDQAFVVEIWRAPIDIWRFAWLYKAPLKDVRDMVRWLIQQEVLLVPAQREENPPPIEVEKGDRS